MSPLTNRLTVNPLEIIRAFSIFSIIFLYQVMQSSDIESEATASVHADARSWRPLEGTDSQIVQVGYDVEFNMTSLSGKIAAIHEDDDIGTYAYGFSLAPVVTTDISLWNSNESLSREEIDFNMLGPGVLSNKTDKIVKNGLCVGTMRHVSGRNAYDAGNHDFYLDKICTEIRP